MFHGKKGTCIKTTSSKRRKNCVLPNPIEGVKRPCLRFGKRAFYIKNGSIVASNKRGDGNTPKTNERCVKNVLRLRLPCVKGAVERKQDWGIVFGDLIHFTTPPSFSSENATSPCTGDCRAKARPRDRIERLDSFYNPTVIFLRKCHLPLHRGGVWRTRSQEVRKSAMI